MTTKMTRRLALAVAAAAMLLVPASASASDMVVLVDPGADPAAVADAVGASPTMTYSSGVYGFAADLSDAQAASLASNPNVVMVAADATRHYASARWHGARWHGARWHGAAKEQETGSLTGATPIEQIAQVATRGFRRVGAATSDSVDLDNKDGGGIDADIAILDSGVQPDQPDLRVAGGVDCTGSGGWADDEGHGTIVAGIAAAKDNRFGIVGVAPGARIWSVKVLDANLDGTDSSILCGISWVTAHADTIDVANMSLEGDGSSDGHCGKRNDDAVHYAICQSVKAGVTYVAAAGNDSDNVKNYVPAAYDEVMAVSAITDSDGAAGGRGGPDPCEGWTDDTFAPFSNFGRKIDIAAPGVCISSTYIGSDVAVDTGTSYATPFVSGAAALYIGSHQGKRELRHVRGADRAEAVRDYVTSQRERGRISGDPDHSNEGVLDVSDF